MRKIYLVLLAGLILASPAIAQINGLPKGFTEDEIRILQENGGLDFNSISRGIETPPDFPNLRTMAEWEEIQTLVISWTSYPGILKQIVRHSKTECKVLILSENVSQTQSYLMGTQAGGPLDNMDNVEIIDVEFDSIWMRDYGANTVYGNEVDDLLLVDWIYNRPTRPNDDASPTAIADYHGLDLYTTTSAPTDLVNTGGNFMVDGFGTAFASKLILEENEAGNIYGVTVKSEEDIDQIMSDFMGIDRYIKMETLPYDNIHHIDMHMKLLDEQTLLMGEYPEGTADGPQINANLEYVLSNFNSMFDEPYKVIRIPMPDSPSGLYPDDNPPGYYRTYTNSVFVNNTVLVPFYREQYDTIAQRIYEDALPGYTIIGIDCDNNSEAIIAASGAIHCITHSIGVEDPLLISHQSLDDTDNSVDPYEVLAYINHRSGIATANLYYRTDEASPYTMVSMSPAAETNYFSASIPAQAVGTVIDYYIEAESVSGKEQVRPMPAPDGYWRFRVTGPVNIDEINAAAISLSVYPNPASAITCIPVDLPVASTGNLYLTDLTGRRVLEIHSGNFPQGESKYFLMAQNLPSGAYVIVLETPASLTTTRLFVE